MEIEKNGASEIQVPEEILEFVKKGETRRSVLRDYYSHHFPFQRILNWLSYRPASTKTKGKLTKNTNYTNWERREVSYVVPTGDFVDATVKWFNADKGYGFVCRADSERDVFIHMVTLRRSGIKELEPGQSVKVRIAEGPKGPQATEIESL